MIIRPYTPADLEAVAQLFTASVHQVAASHYDETQRTAWAPQPPLECLYDDSELPLPPWSSENLETR